jgi:cytochrome c-type biogenesis protein CcmF
VNLALGTAGVVLGLVASVGAVLTLAVGLVRGRPDLLRLSRVYTWLVLLAAVMAFAAMERALITRDFTVSFVAEHGSSRTPALFAVVGPRGLDPAVGALPRRLHGPGRTQVP